MRFGNFLFNESRRPEDDHARITETLAEARLSEALGMDAVWLAEHHFDGNCAYVDPMTFSAAIAAATSRIKIGYAVIQASLHHPIRLAEQLSLIDHLSNGRLMIGLGKGTNYNIYEYQGYDIPHTEAQERYLEIAQIIEKAWTEEAFEHHGKYWNMKVPLLRPRPYTRPHPFIIHAASGEGSMVELARHGLPFLMSVQTNAVTGQRIDLYRRTMRESGFGEEQIARNVGNCWVWRNVFVAETDAEAERIATPAFRQMHENRAVMRRRIQEEQGIAMKAEAAAGANAPVFRDIEKALVCGSPATVAEKLSGLAETGVGGAIMAMRLGPMPHEQFVESATLFMRKVAPEVRSNAYA